MTDAKHASRDGRDALSGGVGARVGVPIMCPDCGLDEDLSKNEGGCGCWIEDAEFWGLAKEAADTHTAREIGWEWAPLVERLWEFDRQINAAINGEGDPERPNGDDSATIREAIYAIEAAVEAVRDAVVLRHRAWLVESPGGAAVYVQLAEHGPPSKSPGERVVALFEDVKP